MKVDIKTALENPGSNGITISGEITKVWPLGKKYKDTEGNEYWYQNVVLKDDSGEITVSLASLEAIDASKVGEKVTFESRPNKRGDLTGVKVLPKDDYGVKVRVTAFANIMFENEVLPAAMVTPNLGQEEAPEEPSCPTLAPEEDDTFDPSKFTPEDVTNTEIKLKHIDDIQMALTDSIHCLTELRKLITMEIEE